MKLRALYCLLLISAAWLPISVRAQKPSVPANQPFTSKTEAVSLDPEAQKFVHEILSQRPEKPTVMYGEIKLTDSDGKRSSIPIKYTVAPEDKGWRGIYETQPTKQRGGERLEIIRQNGEPNQYLYSPAGALNEAPQAPVRLAGSEAAIPFAGSDYWLSDLGIEFLHWPGQHLMRKAIRKSRSCQVLESISPNPAQTKYARVVSWLDAEHGAPIYVEGYNAAGQCIKIFELNGITKASGQWQPKEFEMRNAQTDSKTSLEFSFESK